MHTYAYVCSYTNTYAYTYTHAVKQAYEQLVFNSSNYTSTLQHRQFSEGYNYVYTYTYLYIQLVKCSKSETIFTIFKGNTSNKSISYFLKSSCIDSSHAHMSRYKCKLVVSTLGCLCVISSS